MVRGPGTEEHEFSPACTSEAYDPAQMAAMTEHDHFQPSEDAFC
jgi:hypothetical protein